LIDFKFGVSLSTIEANHLDQMRKWRNTKSIWRWCRQIDLINHDDHMRWFKSLDDRNRMYSIISRDNRFLGVCGLTNIDEVCRRAEISLYIGPEHHRCGHAENGLKTLLKHGFENLNLNLIFGEMMDGNPALRLFKKLGMKIEGVRRSFYYKDGNYIDAILLSIKRDEYECNRF